MPPWLHWLETCPSTNTWALDHREMFQPGDVVFTRQQTTGRGQQGRTWYAPAGVLTASFILDLSVRQLPGLSLRMGLAVVQAVEALLPSHISRLCLKWPNDVLVERHKLAGVLCESVLGSHAQQVRVIVGVGINRCVDFAQAGLTPTHVRSAISWHQLSARVPDEFELLTHLRNSLLQTAAITELVDVLPELQRRDPLRGKPLSFAAADTANTPARTILGRGAGIDSQGRLLIELPGGEVQAFASGRVLSW